MAQTVNKQWERHLDEDTIALINGLLASMPLDEPMTWGQFERLELRGQDAQFDWDAGACGSYFDTFEQAYNSYIASEYEAIHKEVKA